MKCLFAIIAQFKTSLKLNKIIWSVNVLGISFQELVNPVFIQLGELNLVIYKPQSSYHKM